ncbi:MULTISPECIES: sulfotransferase [Rhodomicrobium]|uniref:sulfotransferase family protein n=1 Tax=Rhodomicrobium TaxID=1068 RepID=UPI000B4A6331|nr:MULTISPECIES: sulfotransferase [Rhodomicrobium]
MITPDTTGMSKRPRPVMMIPLRRCGSHALRLRLNVNPDFYSPYPLHIVDFMPLLPLYGDLADDGSYFQLVADVIGLQANNVVKWPGITFDPMEIFDAIQAEPRSVHRIVWELLLRAGETHQAGIVMDKSLDSVRYAEELMALFPDMLFLNVVRDPRAQVASMNRAIIHDFDSTLNAMTWNEAHRLARTLAEQHPARVLTVRYEDFLAGPEHTLRAICQFLDLEFLPGMLDISRSQEASELACRSDLWVSNGFAPIPANIDKYKSQLSMDEIEIIETLAQDHMRHYGYDFMTPAMAAVPVTEHLAACARRSLEGREHAWRQLAQTNYRDYVLRRIRANYLATRTGPATRRRDLQTRAIGNEAAPPDHHAA